LGLRKDGAGGGRFYPFWITLHRFWPGFPLLVPAAFAAFSSDRKRIARVLWCWCLLLLFVLCLPARKWGTHTVVAFPALALLAGAGAGRFLQFWPANQPASRRLSIGVAVLAITLLTADAFGLGRLVQRPPCAVATTFGKILELLPQGADLLVVADPFDQGFFASLADETHVSPWPSLSLDLSARNYSAVLIREGAAASPQGFTERARAGGWMLLMPVAKP
jgi:hypothetical protein